MSDYSVLEWEEDNEYYCNKWWPGWDKNLNAEMKQNLNIKGIHKYLHCGLSVLHFQAICFGRVRGTCNLLEEKKETSSGVLLR